MLLAHVYVAMEFLVVVNTHSGILLQKETSVHIHSKTYSLKWITGENDFKLTWFSFPFVPDLLPYSLNKEKYKLNSLKSFWPKTTNNRALYLLLVIKVIKK